MEGSPSAEGIISPSVPGRNIVAAAERFAEKIAVYFLQGNPVEFGVGEEEDGTFGYRVVRY